MTRIAFCAKSTWDPAIRREHELACLAAEAGHDVVFVERPRDIRTAVGGRGFAWARELRRPHVRREGPITTVRRSTMAPAHRGNVSTRLDAWLLAPVLDELRSQVIVATVPWEWPAVAQCEGARRVFDCADDWCKVMPPRRARLRALYDRVAAEADAIICASESLAELFAPRQATVVRNGTPASLLATHPVPVPHHSTMVYAGTMSERFDAPLVAAVLERLPEWRLDLYGPCLYAGCAAEPDAELAHLLERWPSRITWHGAVERELLAARLDEGDVLVIPHRRRGAVDGGDAMKFYDYAARGKPVATTRWTDAIDTIAPPHTRVAATPEAFAAAVQEAAAEPSEFAEVRRRWAEANAWETRWAAWSRAVFG
jgi:glycosyltransferase involved in cell wall biosynthesis